jgi:hypothetical protein
MNTDSPEGRICATCKVWKPAEEFGHRIGRPEGQLKSYCRECRRNHDRVRYKTRIRYPRKRVQKEGQEETSIRKTQKSKYANTQQNMNVRLDIQYFKNVYLVRRHKNIKYVQLVREIKKSIANNAIESSPLWGVFVVNAASMTIGPYRLIMLKEVVYVN